MTIDESVIGTRADYGSMPEEFIKLIRRKKRVNSVTKKRLIIEAIKTLGAATRNEIICEIYKKHGVFVAPNYTSIVAGNLIKQGVIERYKKMRGVFSMCESANDVQAVAGQVATENLCDLKAES